MAKSNNLVRPGKAALQLILFLLLASLSPAFGVDIFKFSGKYDTKSTVDQTRKDYAEVIFPDLTWTPTADPKSYEKNFVSTINDLTLTLKGDISPNQVLDLNETLHYQTFRPEDYSASSLDAYKYIYLDHLFDLTYGISFGKSDMFQLDYINNIYRMPIDKTLEYTSNKGKGRFNHKMNKYSALAFEGGLEEREYPGYKSYDYREASFIIDFSTFIPEKIRYKPISHSSRGEKYIFEKTPLSLTPSKAIDFYTTWTKNPRDDEPDAKYLAQVIRGDLSIGLMGDFRSRVRTTIDNGYFQPSGILKIQYDANDKLKVGIDETYYDRRHERESDTYYLYDHHSNNLSAKFSYYPDQEFTYILTLTDERYIYTTHKDQDYNVDTFSLETYFVKGLTNVSLYLKEIQTRYGQPRLYFPDSNQHWAILGYDYSITPKWVFHLKDEWLDYDYTTIEDLLYSSYVRNTWRISLEEKLSKNFGIELGYQDKRERHKVYVSNNVTEKSAFFSFMTYF